MGVPGTGGCWVLVVSTGCQGRVLGTVGRALGRAGGSPAGVTLQPSPQVVYNTVSPVWEEAFRFFLHDPSNQDLDVQVAPAPSPGPTPSCLPHPTLVTR